MEESFGSIMFYAFVAISFQVVVAVIAFKVARKFIFKSNPASKTKAMLVSAVVWLVFHLGINIAVQWAADATGETSSGQPTPVFALLCLAGWFYLRKGNNKIQTEIEP